RRNKPPGQIGRQQIDVFLERVDVRFVELFGEPTPKRIERPDIADALLMLEQRMNLGDHRQRLGCVERSALRKLDIDLERIGPGQLYVQTLAGLDRLLSIRYLVGEAITRVQLRIANR